MKRPLLRTGQLGWVALFLLVALLATSGTCANYDLTHQRSSVGGMTEFEFLPMVGKIGLVLAAVGFAAFVVAEIVVRIPHDRSRWPGIALGSAIFTVLSIMLSSLMFPLFAILALAGTFVAMVSIIITASPKTTPEPEP